MYKHVDNGGITVEIHQSDDEYKNLSIQMKTQYLGYPDISTTLNLWGYFQPDFLKELGLMLIETSVDLKN